MITGFLGSGKTTFLKLYAKYLMDSGLRVGILENDYGAVNVDMLMLRELEGERCGLEMVAGACCSDCHRRRFKTKLIAMAMSGYDRVIIEPSGVFDIDEFFDTLSEEPLDRWYETGTVAAVVDADLEDGLSESADYLLASQVSGAGVVVLSKTGLASEEEKRSAIAHIERALRMTRCEKDISGILLDKDWSLLDGRDFERVMNSGSDVRGFVKRGGTDSSGFGSVYLLNKSFTSQTLAEKARLAFESEKCGRVFRIKGYVGENGGWTEFNATRKITQTRRCEAGQAVVIVIGENLNRDEITRIFS